MTAPRVRFPIGISDFRMLREGGYRYVDKTALVDAVVDADAQVLLLPRPRRFGKTLNLSMLRCFLEKGGEDHRSLFDGLAAASSEDRSAYDVRSNRESGFGRCDVMVLPKAAGKPGVVLELKRVDADVGETPEQAIASALAQIRARDYAAELRERGASPIHLFAAVFDGKRAYVRVG